MRFKVVVALTIALALGHRSRGGLVSLEGEPFHGQEGIFHGRAASLEETIREQQQTSAASSYVQFHGPVEGPEFEVKVPQTTHHDDSNHLHGQEQQEQEYAVDYVAHPKYEFSYGVEDHRTGDFHGQKETRDGSTVSGQYSVKEPGGNVRVVKYHADKDGFHAVVHTSGQNDHSSVAYGGQGHDQVHVHQATPQQEQDIPDYEAYATNDGY